MQDAPARPQEFARHREAKRKRRDPSRVKVRDVHKYLSENIALKKLRDNATQTAPI